MSIDNDGVKHVSTGQRDYLSLSFSLSLISLPWKVYSGEMKLSVALHTISFTDKLINSEPRAETLINESATSKSLSVT